MSKSFLLKMLFVAFLIAFIPLKALPDNNLLYKCDPKENKLEFKSLYFYTQTAHINKFNTIKSLESSGYKNLGSPENLLIRNNKGFVVSTRLINLDCKINNHVYQTTIGSSPGNINPIGNCGAFSSFWIIIKDNGKIILPKFLFQKCGSDSAVAEIIVKPNTKVQILKTNPYSHNESPSPSPMDTNDKRTIYVGQTPASIAADPFGNIWVGNYQSKDIVKINQSGKEFKYNLNAPVSNVAVDLEGNIFCIAGNHIVKLNQKGMIIGTYYITQNPNYIYIDPKNNVWVDDWKSGELFKLNPNGTILNRYWIGGGPYQMVMDQEGNLWIAESYGPLAVLYSNGYLKNCLYARDIVAKDNSIWIVQGSLLASGPYLERISYNCSFLSQSYKLNIQPAGIAIDNEGNIWISGSTKYGGGYLEELSKTGEYKHIYPLGKFPGPLTIDKYGNVWVISGQNTVTEFYRVATIPKNNPTINQGSGVNPHLPIAIHHTFPENNIGK
jgi:streptogramin lyase